MTDFSAVVGSINARDVVSFASGLGLGSIVSALVTYRLARRAKSHDARLEADRKLYTQATELLQPDRVADFLTHIGSSFRQDDMRPFDDFYFKWRGPERHFHDPKVDAARAALHHAIDKFLGYVATETFEVGHDKQGVPPEWKRDDPERHKRVLQELHNHASDVHQAYQQFVKVARKGLLV